MWPFKGDDKTSDECCHQWTQWALVERPGTRLYLSTGKRGPCLVRYQWRECEVCGYTQEEEMKLDS